MDSEHRVMQKETVVKDDGRRLIYYRFVPDASEAGPSAARTDETPTATPKEP